MTSTVTAARPTQTVSLSDLAGLTLGIGDNDKKQQWGGKTWVTLKGTPVFDLQSALVSVGLLKNVDGDFGLATKDAIARYQWYRTKIPYALQLRSGAASITGTITPCNLFSGQRTFLGTCSQGLACDLLAWKNANLVITTPLVRVNIKCYSSISLSPEFHALQYPFAQPDEIVLHSDFAGFVGVLDEAAKNAGVSVIVTQAFRVEGAPIHGARVRPATNSPHLIGHAIDWNVKDGDDIYGHDIFLAHKESEAADKFVQEVKSRGYRWGMEFRSPGPDPVHFDDNPYQNVECYAMNHFFAQHCYQAGHPMRLIAG